jgi:hypothetical protein
MRSAREPLGCRDFVKIQGRAVVFPSTTLTGAVPAGCTSIDGPSRTAFGTQQETAVLDVVFVVVTVGLFAVLALIVRGAERL